MKKFLLVLSVLLLSSVYADYIRVQALTPFSSINPSEKISVKILEDSTIEEIDFLKGNILNCDLIKLKSVKRGKIDAKAYFSLENFENKLETKKIEKELIAKYSPRTINKETIKQIEPKNAILKTAGVVGNFFLQGISYAVSFVDGIVENKEDNRLKSGVKQVYDDSFLSYVEEGNEIDIKKGDEIFLVIKKISKRDLEKQLEKEEELEKQKEIEENKQVENIKPEVEKYILKEVPKEEYIEVELNEK